MRSWAKGLLALGAAAMLGGLVAYWEADTHSLHPIWLEITLGVTSLVIMGMGPILILAGCILLCAISEPKSLMRSGSSITIVATIVVPIAGYLLHFEVNVHDWTGLLLIPWIVSWLCGLMLLIGGYFRFVISRREHRKP